MKFSRNNRQNFNEREFIGYLIDFQHIVVIRIIIFLIMDQWFGINIIEYYENCSLRRSLKFYINENTLIVFIGINIIITLIFIGNVIKGKIKGFEFNLKRHLALVNTYYILLFDGAFEIQLQEYHAIFFQK